MQKSPCHAQTLALAARKGTAQLPYRRIVALGQGHDKIVDGRFFASPHHLLVGGVLVGYAQIFLNAVVEQHGVLLDEALGAAQAGGVDLFNVHAGQFDFAQIRIPEAHHQLEQRGFAAAAAASDADDGVLRHFQRYVVQNHVTAIAKGHTAAGSAGKGDVLAAGHFPHGGLLVQHVQHTVARGKGVLQSGAQVGQGNDRAEAAHQRHHGDQAAVKADGAALGKARRQRQHTGVQQQNDAAGDSLGRAARQL